MFDGLGASTPDFSTSISSAIFQQVASFGDRWVVIAAAHQSLCQLAFGELWDRSKEQIMSELTARKLFPKWDIHPFA
jgi:hypothetical protein